MVGTIQGGIRHPNAPQPWGAHGRAELGVISLQPEPFLWEICTSQKLAQSRAIALPALGRESSAVSLASPPKQLPAAGGTHIILPDITLK